MAAKKTNVEIPAIQKSVVVLKIRGISPLVVNNFPAKIAREMLEKQQLKGKQAKGARDIEAEFHDARHIIDDKTDGFPAGGFKKAAVSACRQVDGIAMTLARGAFHVNLGQDLVAIDAPHGPKMREDMVRIGGKGPGTGTAMPRFRPEYWPWSAELEIVYNPGVISAGQIANLVNTAGFAVGIGENRPEKGGSWGMFELAEDVE